jgi:NAD(P)H-nitrite reductase large subunit
MPDIPKGAILQRDKETYAIVPRTPVGLVSPDDLERIVKVARKYQISRQSQKTGTNGPVC